MTQAPKIRTPETWANKSVEAKNDFPGIEGIDGIGWEWFFGQCPTQPFCKGQGIHHLQADKPMICREIPPEMVGGISGFWGMVGFSMGNRKQNLRRIENFQSAWWCILKPPWIVGSSAAQADGTYGAGWREEGLHQVLPIPSQHFRGIDFYADNQMLRLHRRPVWMKNLWTSSIDQGVSCRYDQETCQK